MNNFPNKKDRIIVCVFTLIILVPAMSFLIFSITGDIVSIILAVVFVSLEVFGFVLTNKVSKGYFLKYYFNRKIYKKELEEGLKRFPKASDNFIKEYKKTSLNNYFQSGHIFYTPTIEESKWLYSKEDERLGLTEIVLLLKKCIKEETYLVGFSKDAVKLHDSTYHILMVIIHSGLPKELKYLLADLYDKCEFNLEDNGLNNDYTEYLEKQIEMIHTEYDPLISEFEEDIDKYLSVLVKQNNETNIVA